MSPPSTNPRTTPPRSVVRAVMALRIGLQALADRLAPAELALLEQTVGSWRTYVIGALAELKVADELARGPATAAELAPRLGADADALHRLLRGGAALRVLKMDGDGRFSLARMGQALRSDSKLPLGGWARYMASPATSAAWAALPESVRDGQSAFPRVHGQSVWDHFASNPDEEAHFADGMRRMTENDLPSIVGGYPWPDEGVVCDVAGGVGTLLVGVLSARPGLRGVLVDAPGVLAEAKSYLSQAGVSDRVELVAGNMFEEVTARADVYVMKDVMHDWGDPACAQILSTVRATMPSGSTLVLVESLQERNEVEPITSLVDLQMLTQCDDGRQRSRAELAKLLGDAGLEPGEVRVTAGPALVEATAP